MSHKSGDRARADKQSRKRRVRRSLLQPLRKAINAAKPRIAQVAAPAPEPGV